MTTVRAYLHELRIAPRKVRLLADDIRGKRVSEADTALRFRVKRGAAPMRKLLQSAIANAKENAKIANPESVMYVGKIMVDEGRVLKRMMPRAFGRASAINKRTSNVTLELHSYDAVSTQKASKSKKV